MYDLLMLAVFLSPYMDRDLLHAACGRKGWGQGEGETVEKSVSSKTK
jgi:hypothetical protein